MLQKRLRSSQSFNRCPFLTAVQLAAQNVQQEKLLYFRCFTMADDEDVVCDVCNRTFTRFQYYKAHLKYQKNKLCAIRSRSYGNSLPEKRGFGTLASTEDGTNLQHLAQKSRTMVGKSVHLHNSSDHAELMSGDEDGSHLEESDEESPGILDGDSVNSGHLPTIGDDFDDDTTIHDNTPVDSSIWEEFKQYSDYAVQNTCDLPAEIEAGIELMHLLSVKRVPLCLYDEIYQWHLDNIEARDKMPRQTLLNKLNDRYYMHNK
jgi:hypothetical protein